MKKFYYITFLAALTVIGLQTGYIYNLYKSYKEDKTARLQQVLKTAIDNELVYNSWKGADMEKVKKSIQEFTRRQDSINKQLPKASVGETTADISMRFLQDARANSGYPANVAVIARYFSPHLQADERRYAIHLLDKNQSIIASADSLQGHRPNYISNPIPISAFGLQYIRLEAYIPPSSFILQNIGILTASLLLALIALLCVGLQLGKIRRQAALLQRREETINGTIHDLKSPLNSAFTTLGWIASGETNEAKRKAIERVQAEVKHQVSNIEALLVTVRKDRNRLVLKKEDIDMPRLAELTIGSLNTLYREKPHHIELVNRLPQGIRIHADGMYIENVLRNLVENALKYADDGVEVTVTLSADARNLNVDVADNGWGIAPCHLKKIFWQFYQVPQTEERIRKGYGIGLAQSKYIIDEHKGKISVRSTEGKGSTFSFSIPLE